MLPVHLFCKFVNEQWEDEEIRDEMNLNQFKFTKNTIHAIRLNSIIIHQVSVLWSLPSIVGLYFYTQDNFQ